MGLRLTYKQKSLLLAAFSLLQAFEPAWSQNSKTQLQALLTQGDASSKKFQLQQAEDAYRQALKIDPRSVPALLGLSAIYRHRGRAQLSNSFIETATKIEPNNPRCYLASARLFEKLQDTEQAIRAYKKVVALDPSDAHSLQMLSWNQLENHTLEAEQNLRRLIKMAPTNDGAYRLLAYAQSNEKHYDEARRTISTAIKMAPTNPNYYQDLATICLRANDTAGAKKALKEMLTKFPGNPAPLLGLAEIAAREGQYKEQEKYLRQATVVKPTSDLAWRELAVYYGLRRNQPECIRCARIAYGFKPKSAKNNYCLAACLLDSDNLKEAEPYMQKAVELADSLEEQLTYERQQIHLKFLLGKNDEAMAQAKKLYKQYPHNLTAIRSMAWALMCFKQYDQGFALLKQAMAKFPEDSSIARDYLEGLLSAGRYDQARAEARKLLLKEPNDEECWSCLMEIAQKTGNKKEAEEAMKHIGKLNLSAHESMEFAFNSMSTGANNKALPALKKALESSPDSADLLLNTRDPRAESPPGAKGQKNR
ncbi:MAG: tetratricopeptide repeat protein [Cyanobacteria bacterium SZAS LIN-3]|nr:tetratricopeptide repeat protein [Cyanobacteria bacterium SZAS LIN-3]